MPRRANGEGSFAKLENGMTRLRQQHGFRPNGTPRILTVTGKTKSECIRLMKEKVERTPDVVDPAGIGKGTITNLCRKHLSYNLALRDYLKPTAADRRESTINNQIDGYPLGSMRVLSVKSQDIEQHIERLIAENRLSISSIEKTFHAVNGAFKWAISQGVLYFNPCDSIKDRITNRFSKLSAKGAVDADVVVLSEEEERYLVEEAMRVDKKGKPVNPVGPAVLFLLYSGMRVGELCALKWGDIWIHKSWERVTVTIRRTRHYVKVRSEKKNRFTVMEGSVKNAHARTIALSTDAIFVLKGMHERSADVSEDAYVFVNARGNPSNPSNLGVLINNLYRSAGLPDDITGAHVLRRTFATKLFFQGAAIKSIASYIGDLESTTEKYYIAVRKTVRAGNRVLNVVPLPSVIKTGGDDSLYSRGVV